METRLLWEFIAPTDDFHAALVDIRAVRGFTMPPHRHDFHELLFVLSGSALHATAGCEFEMSPHTLILIRPHDGHTIKVRRGASLQYINLAFRSALWQQCLSLAGPADFLEKAQAPPHRLVPDDIAPALRADFEGVLRAYHEGEASRWPLLQLWSRVAPLLLGEETPVYRRTLDARLEAAPDWLRRAADAMRGGENLRGGVARLQRECGVSAGHLARTLKAHTGQSPREWVLARRLERAARLLATSTLAVEEVGRDCGFANSAYFYRTFAREFGVTPRGYRIASRSRVAPESQDGAG